MTTTVTRPLWVLPGQQWYGGQTQLQFEQAGGKLASGFTSVLRTPTAPVAPTIDPALVAFNQQMVNAPAPTPAYIAPVSTPISVPTATTTTALDLKKRAGETLEQFSARTGISVDALKSASNFPNPNYYDNPNFIINTFNFGQYPSLVPLPTPAPPAPAATYTGVSIVNYLASVGQPSDYASRAKLAQQQGITNYTGTAAQNTQLLNTLRSQQQYAPTSAPKLSTDVVTPPGGPVQPLTWGATPAVPVTPTPPITQQQYQYQPGETTPQYNARIAALRGEAPPATSITSPITAPTGTGATPTLTTPQAPAATTSYYTGATADFTNAQAAYDKAYKDSLAKVQADKVVAQKQLDDIRTLQLEGIYQQGQVASEEKQKILDQLTIQEARFNENYNIVQGLAGELQSLLTQGNDLVLQMQGVTGLASIRNPRITEATNAVTARAGVLQAAISVYNGQMNQAQSQLMNATSVIQAAYTDQLNYFTTLNNFYNQKADDTNQKLVTLTKDERNYLDANVSYFKEKLDTTQANVDYIKKLMTSPATALLISQSGVNLNDTPEQVNAKLASQAYLNDRNDKINAKTDDGLTYLPTQVQISLYPADQLETIYDAQGQPMVFKRPAAALKAPTESVVDIRQQRNDLADLLAQVATYQSREQAVSELNNYKASIVTRIGQEGFNQIQREVDRKFPAPVEEKPVEEKIGGGIFETVTGAVKGFFSRLFGK